MYYNRSAFHFCTSLLFSASRPLQRICKLLQCTSKFLKEKHLFVLKLPRPKMGMDAMQEPPTIISPVRVEDFISSFKQRLSPEREKLIGRRRLSQPSLARNIFQQNEGLA